MRVILICILLTTVLITSCRKKVHINTTYERCVVVSINPPKHVYVDLKMLSSGKLYTDVYVSKHCNDMCVSVGDTILTTYVKYKYGDDVYTDFENIYDTICNCN